MVIVETIIRKIMLRDVIIRHQLQDLAIIPLGTIRLLLQDLPAIHLLQDLAIIPLGKIRHWLRDLAIIPLGAIGLQDIIKSQRSHIIIGIVMLPIVIIILQDTAILGIGRLMQMRVIIIVGNGLLKKN
jgi:hypothetical protein